MAIIEPLRQDTEHPRTIKKYSRPLRFWHWANALVITGSLLTVLLNLNFLKSKENAHLIQADLLKDGAVITDDQAKTVLHTLREEIWAIHIWFGWALVALLVFRLVMEFFQLADQKLIMGIKSAYRHYFIIKKQRELARHELVVKTIYAVFYLMLITMAVTGLILIYRHDLNKDLTHIAKEVHEFTMYLVLAFIAVHLVGVFLGERNKSKGIVSDMINGGGE
jgi:Ni/Fe-hydrogenase 1 B-type cytochrome subunit